MCAAHIPPAGLDHRALIYDGLDQFVETAGTFVREGVEQGEPVWMITGPARRDALRESLGAAFETVEHTEADTWFRTAPRTLAAFTYRVGEHRGPGAIRALGELPLAGATVAGQREWVGFEAMLNHVFAERPVNMLCSYDAQRLPDHVLDAACRTHPAVQSGAEVSPSPSYAEPEAVMRGLHELPIEPVPGAAASMRFDDRPAPARDFVTARATDAGLSGARLDDLRVAVAEIITNAILHGRLPHWVHVWATADELVCEVQDGGGGIESPFIGLIVPEVDAPGGRGVWIARQLCDRLQVSGARVRLHFRR